MRLGTTEGFLKSLNPTSGTLTSLLRLSPCLLPLPYPRPNSGLARWNRCHLRPISSHGRLYLRPIDGINLSKAPQSRQDGFRDFVRGPRKREPQAWVAALDEYLPLSLRAAAQTSNHDSKIREPLPIEQVPLFLDGARQAAKIDLLSYLGIYEERWEAVYWLINSMIRNCPPYADMKRRCERLPVSPWDDEERGFDEITRSNIELRNLQKTEKRPTAFLDTTEYGFDAITRRRMEGEDTQKTEVRLDDLLDHGLLGKPQPTVMAARQILGELWQTLGCMLLEIEDRSSENPNRPVILAHVLQIFAHMHHTGVIPDSIYNYDLNENSSLTRRPPTIYLLSGRILNVLSDISWKSYWAHEMEKAESVGYELPLPPTRLHLPRVGPEVWLELVLWACVEGGWIAEAGWLIREIQQRRDNPDRRWSVIGWDEIASKKVQELGWLSSLKKEIDRSHSNQAMGITIAKRGTSNINPEMGTRKISREVVLAIADGLTNIVTDTHLHGTTLSKVQNYLLSCQGLLERGQLFLNSNYVNTLILRTIESSVIDTRLQPGYLQMLLALTPKEPESGTSSSRTYSAGDNMLDNSAPVLGLQHRLLDCYARQGNLKGSLQTLRAIQEGIDSNRDISIQKFADDLRGRLLHGSQPFDVPEILEARKPLMLYPELPAFVLEAFLDLLVESKAFELGHWVLSNDDIDGGIFNKNSFSDVSLQPALLRFATATANDSLLLRVLENLEAPLSPPVLHALLRCQIAVNRWDAVEGILKHLRDTHGMAWTPVDAVSIAAAIPVLEWKHDMVNMGHLLQAKGILQALVQGEFNTPRNQAQVPDLQETRTANQLGRIFQSVTGTLSTIVLGAKGYLGRANYSVAIPSDAFNILLASIVKVHGPLEGIKFWDRWCFEPAQSGPLNDGAIPTPHDDASERVVEPTISMLRLILQPATESLKDTLYSSIAELASSKSRERALNQESSSEDDKKTGDQVRSSLKTAGDSLSVFDWCITMYRRFGFSDRAIHSELPPSFGRIIEIRDSSK